MLDVITPCHDVAWFVESRSNNVSVKTTGNDHIAVLQITTNSHPGGDNSMSSYIPRPNFSPITMSTPNMHKTDFALFDIVCYDVGYDITFHTTSWEIIVDSQPLFGHFSFETMSNVCLHVNTWRHNKHYRLYPSYSNCIYQPLTCDSSDCTFVVRDATCDLADSYCDWTWARLAFSAWHSSFTCTNTKNVNNK